MFENMQIRVMGGKEEDKSEGESSEESEEDDETDN